MPFGLFDLEPSAAAIARPGGGEGGTATLCVPLILFDDPSQITERGANLCRFSTCTHHLAPGDVICVRSRPGAPSYCRTAVLINGANQSPHYALPPSM